MKVIVFGATGGTGRQVVAEAVAEGHMVTAFVRRAGRLGLVDENLYEVVGDVLDPAAVAAAINGHDAVICALGRPVWDKSGLRAKATDVIVDAMKKAGVMRLVCLSSMGAGGDWRGMPWIYRWFVLPVYLRRALADHDAQEAIIENSALDWVIVRPSHLTDGPAEGTYSQGMSLQGEKLSLKISRADVARFMMEQVRAEAYLWKTPWVSC